MSIVKAFSPPPYNYGEILRYSGAKGDNSDLRPIIDECIEELDGKLKFLVCYDELSLKTEGDTVIFDSFFIRSKSLAKNLSGCERAILFSATVGIELDRLILKYGQISPTKALFFQSIGAERIEALCDAFCDFVKEENANKRLCPRFSAGYGDCSLEAQRDVFRILDPTKKIGVSLTENLMMIPTKSVSAFIGIK